MYLRSPQSVQWKIRNYKKRLWLSFSGKLFTHCKPQLFGSQDTSPEELSTLDAAQGMLLAVIPVALQKPSGKSLQKPSYLLKKKKSLSLHLLCWLNPSGNETSAPAVSGWSLLNLAHGNNNALWGFKIKFTTRLKAGRSAAVAVKPYTSN